MNAIEARCTLKYSPDTGIITWRRRGEGYKMFNTHFAGTRAGSVVAKGKNKGYRRIHVLGTNYHAGRVAWLLYYGRWPEHFIDHINGVRDDNRIANLRDVTNRENSLNQKRSRANTSGVVGVRYHKGARHIKRWIAEICVGEGAKVRSKSFHTFEEAVQTRQQWSRELGYHENHGREK